MLGFVFLLGLGLEGLLANARSSGSGLRLL